MGEVGDLAMFNGAVLAVGLAKVDGLVDLAVGGGPLGVGYLHDYKNAISSRSKGKNRDICKLWHGYKIGRASCRERV